MGVRDPSIELSDEELEFDEEFAGVFRRPVDFVRVLLDMKINVVRRKKGFKKNLPDKKKSTRYWYWYWYWYGTGTGPDLVWYQVPQAY